MYSTECLHITSFNLHQLEGMKREAHKEIVKNNGIAWKYKNTLQCPRSEGNIGIQEVEGCEMLRNTKKKETAGGRK